MLNHFCRNGTQCFDTDQSKCINRPRALLFFTLRAAVTCRATVRHTKRWDRGSYLGLITKPRNPGVLVNNNSYLHNCDTFVTPFTYLMIKTCMFNFFESRILFSRKFDKQARLKCHVRFEIVKHFFSNLLVILIGQTNITTHILHSLKNIKAKIL